MLTGDLPSPQELHLVDAYSIDLPSTVLKAGHHGSKNSSSLEFLKAVDPTYAVYSRGCNNRYGHPALQTVERFNSLNIPTFDTCTEGSITFNSNGKSLTYSVEKSPQ